MPAFYTTTARYALRWLTGASGRRDIDTGFQSLAEDVEAAISAENFPGKVIWTARATSPNAFYILCDGASLLRAGTYANLFAAIGTTHGSADGTHFNVPDLRGRVMVHPDGTANRLAANDALGNSGGVETVALTANQNGLHAHILRSEAISGGIGVNVTGAAGRVARHGADAITAGAAGNPDLMTEDSGTGAAHTNLQPYVILTALIHV